MSINAIKLWAGYTLECYNRSQTKCTGGSSAALFDKESVGPVEYVRLNDIQSEQSVPRLLRRATVEELKRRKAYDDNPPRLIELAE
jgi:hypothetical protein